jgi:formamidopyrimidine-DNA glycosylase
MEYMIELPEAISLSRQLNKTIAGKTISKVTAAHTKHKFTWYYGAPEKYQEQLNNKKINNAVSFGGFVEISAEDMKILFSEGANLRFFRDGEKIPDKHQLLIEFSDGSFLCANVQMYGGVGCYLENTLDNKYYMISKEKPSPLSTKFDQKYYDDLIEIDPVQKISVKAFCATEQRIPGLGNGVLQDILYNAKIHPKRKIQSLSKKEKTNLFDSIKNTLQEMSDLNGRDTEKDLFSQPGEYITKVSKNTVGSSCERCGSLIEKSNYMGGSVYYCKGCQQI